MLFPRIRKAGGAASIFHPKGYCAMAGKKNKPIKLEELTQEEKMKYEIAEELGLLDKVMQEGWRSLSSKETGRIGGLMTKKRREAEKK